MRPSELLREAKECLPYERYVCWALRRAYEIRYAGNQGDYAVFFDVRARILESLDGECDVATWLMKNGYANQRYSENGKKMLAYRLAWIDWMIEGYERVGQ